MPHFTLEDVHKYLLNSPDKEFDGESLRAYKQLRSYQLFDERHIHDIEINLWEKGSHLFSSVQSVGHRRTRAKMPTNVLFALIGKSRAAMALTADACPVQDRLALMWLGFCLLLRTFVREAIALCKVRQ